jgi:hypothetical protein
MGGTGRSPHKSERSAKRERSWVAEGTRTPDHRDHNPGLYQLSYRHRAVPRRVAGLASGEQRLVEPLDELLDRLEDSSRAGVPELRGGETARRCRTETRVRLGASARSSVEEQRPSKPSVGGSNPPGRDRRGCARVSAIGRGDAVLQRAAEAKPESARANVISGRRSPR